MKAPVAAAVAAVALLTATGTTAANASTIKPRPATRTFTRVADTAATPTSTSTSTTTAKTTGITATTATRPASTAAFQHREAWRGTSIRAFGMAEAAIGTHGTSVFVHASLARAAANLYGWQDARTRKYLSMVLAAQHADGGWGLDATADAFGDGTVNAASTSYTITTVDHVGPLLVDGYRAGVVPRTVLDRARQSVMTTSTTTTTDGSCIAYSRSTYDAATPDRCVHNVNAAAAWFLTANVRLGLASDADAGARARSMLRYDTARLLTVNRWPYLGQKTTTPQDLDHNSLNVEAHILADGGLDVSPLGRLTLAAALAAPLTADYTDRLAWLRLATFDPARSYQWQPYGDWLLANTPRTSNRPTWRPTETTIRYAQVALYSSRAALDAR